MSAVLPAAGPPPAAAKVTRQSVGYESSVPRCATCSEFRAACFGNTKFGQPQFIVPAFCKKHRFKVREAGCCDQWCSTKGERLVSDQGKGESHA